jgi:hypothetical protein
MVELTDREKKIVLIKFIMHGAGPFQFLPVNLREKELIIAMRAHGFDYNKDEMLDLADAIVETQQRVLDFQVNFLENFKSADVEMALKHAMDSFKKRLP